MFLGPGETRCHDAPDNGRISFRHRPDFVVENTVSADVFRVREGDGDAWLASVSIAFKRMPVRAELRSHRGVGWELRRRPLCGATGEVYRAILPSRKRNDPCGADGFLKRDRAAVDDKMVGEDLHKLEAAARVSSVRLVGHGAIVFDSQLECHDAEALAYSGRRSGKHHDCEHPAPMEVYAPCQTVRSSDSAQWEWPLMATAFGNRESARGASPSSSPSESGAQSTQAQQHTAKDPGETREGEIPRYEYDEAPPRRYRETTKAFYDFLRANPRAKGTPETKIAFALGNGDAFVGMTTDWFAVWGLHGAANRQGLHPAQRQAARRAGRRNPAMLRESA